MPEVIVHLSPEQVMSAGTSYQTQKLGTVGRLEDGRVFRYAQAGASDLVAYRICVSAAESPLSTATDVAFYSAYAAGSTRILIGGQATATDLGTAANDFKDGWLVVSSTSLTYAQQARIHSHAALASSTALGSANYLNLYPPGLAKVVSTDAATCFVKLVHNPYKKVVVSAGAQQALTKADYRAVGVPLANITASYYFWIQTWGPCLVRAGGGGAMVAADRAGSKAYLSTGDTGAYQCYSSEAKTDTASGNYGFEIAGPIGTVMTAAPVANFYSMIDLQIAP